MKTSALFLIVATFMISNLSAAQGTGCSGAPSLPVNSGCVTTSFTVNNGTSGVAAPACAPTINDDAWYQFTAIGSPTTVTISGGSNPIAIAVYSGSCGSLTSVGATIRERVQLQLP